MKYMKVKLGFIESILGTCPSDPDVYRTYIGKKSPDAATIDEEVAALGADTVAENQMTIFPTLEDGTPFLYDYQIKGFFKDTCGGLRRVPGTRSAGIKSYKKEIDKLIFPYPRRIPFEGVEEILECQRPLRAQTAQGERVTLAMSEEIPAGAVINFGIVIKENGYVDTVKEWLDYGVLSGIGQWRNASHGRFIWKMIELKEITDDEVAEMFGDRAATVLGDDWFEKFFSEE